MFYEGLCKKSEQDVDFLTGEDVKSPNTVVEYGDYSLFTETDCGTHNFWEPQVQGHQIHKLYFECAVPIM